LYRVARSLKRQGLLQQDAENSYLELDTDEQPMDQLIGNSITYRIAVGPNQGRKVFSLQTLPPQPDESSTARVAKVAGFSLHAGVMAEAHQRDKLERLCRYISRPAVSEKRLSVTSNGQIRYQLKTPYRNGTTHVIFSGAAFRHWILSPNWLPWCPSLVSTLPDSMVSLHHGTSSGTK